MSRDKATMMKTKNPRHMSESNEWLTPIGVIEASRRVLETIDLDPASSEFGNSRVMAKRYYTKEQDGLKQPWFGSVFCNPPGGRIPGTTSFYAVEFWAKLMEARRRVLIEGSTTFKHAIFVGFSINILATTQGFGFPSACCYPVCVPARRIAFDRPDGTPSKSPSHVNAIVYVPGVRDMSEKFAREFSRYGEVLNVD